MIADTVSEEGGIAPAGVRRTDQRVWLVDSLDGTKEYMRGDDDRYCGAVGWGGYRLRGTESRGLAAGAGTV